MLSSASSLMAVYYDATQQRKLGRLLHANQVRAWIRGNSGAVYTNRSATRLMRRFDEASQFLTEEFERINLAREECRAERLS